MIGSLLGAGLGATLGGGNGFGNAGRFLSAQAGMEVGASLGALAGALLNRPLIVAWDQVEEDQADQMAFKAVLDANYDVREVPNLYVAMQKIASRDTRVGLGFLGSRRRIEQRMEKAKDLIANAYKAEIEAGLKHGFLSMSAEHQNLMAELKRDNGIMAYYNDMFDLARANLAGAVAIRGNDPAAHYFYGKVLKLIGRTVEEERLATAQFIKAAEVDTRNENFGSHLHKALLLAQDRNADKGEITKELDAYVSDYAHWNIMDRALRAFPPNLDSIYEYMSMYGDPGWQPKPPDLSDVNPEYLRLSAEANDPQALRAPAQQSSGKADPAGKTTAPGVNRPGEVLLPGGRVLPTSIQNPIKKQ
jgi:hypothetical protein